VPILTPVSKISDCGKGSCDQLWRHQRHFTTLPLRAEVAQESRESRIKLLFYLIRFHSLCRHTILPPTEPTATLFGSQPCCGLVSIHHGTFVIRGRTWILTRVSYAAFISLFSDIIGVSFDETETEPLCHYVNATHISPYVSQGPSDQKTESACLFILAPKLHGFYSTSFQPQKRSLLCSQDRKPQARKE